MRILVLVFGLLASACAIGNDGTSASGGGGGGSCCKYCGSNSKACGDSCISPGKMCSKVGGCACEGAPPQSEDSVVTGDVDPTG